MKTVFQLFFVSLVHSGGKFIEHPNSCIPVDAGVGDADSVLELVFWRELLVALQEVTFDHHGRDRARSCGDLFCDVGRHFWLVAVVFIAVAV